MEESSNPRAVTGFDYWLQWQVLVCALIFILPTATALILLRKKAGGRDSLNSADLWIPCWRNLHPRWLLFYRAFAFFAMAFLLYLTVASFGFFVFFFYTQKFPAVTGFDYWLQWQVLVCALIFILPTATALILLRKKAGGRDSLNSADLWIPCWRDLHPRWLLFYRAFAVFAMSFLLYLTVASFGFFVFFFYTQWTFALVMVYFAVATIVSIKGCRVQSRKPLTHSGERERILKKESEETNYETTAISEQQVGFLENLLQIIYLTCAGAVLLTDIVFWCLLLPFMTGENFKLTLLIGLMHSVNAVFLLVESLLNLMSFPWFGIVYFVLWSGAYLVFQWVLHACCFTWWPYPFLDLSTPLAPLWYLALALVHVPCYGLYVLLMKGKKAALSRMFPHTFMRVSTEKKHD